MKNYMGHSVAHCGINCSLCYAYQRKRCTGCGSEGAQKPVHCLKCGIKECGSRSGEKIFFCCGCTKYPCRRMRDLKKRYLVKYNVDIEENFQRIMDAGVEKFTENERIKWKCPGCGEQLCMHKIECLQCGGANPFFPKTGTG